MKSTVKGEAPPVSLGRSKRLSSKVTGEEHPVSLGKTSSKRLLASMESAIESELALPVSLQGKNSDKGLQFASGKNKNRGDHEDEGLQIISGKSKNSEKRRYTNWSEALPLKKRRHANSSEITSGGEELKRKIQEAIDLVIAKIKQGKATKHIKVTSLKLLYLKKNYMRFHANEVPPKSLIYQVRELRPNVMKVLELDLNSPPPGLAVVIESRGNT